jgi:signal transduction histidine kinase/CheY-like chemotaxis protein
VLLLGVCGVLALAAPELPAPGAARPAGKDVLILSGNQIGAPVTEASLNGAFYRLKERGISGRNVYVETLDLERNTNPDYPQKAADYLRFKLQAARPGAVIVLGVAGMKFFNTVGQDLVAPDVPVIAARVLDTALPASDSGRSLLVLPDRIDVTGTVDAALKVFPATQRIVVVSGAASGFLPHYLAQAKVALAHPPRPVAVEFLTELRYDEMLKRIAALPPATVVLYLPFFQDGAGRRFVPAEVAATVGKTANAPVFAMFAPHLVPGVVGGAMADPKQDGEQAADAAAEIALGRRQVVPGRTDLPLASPLVLDWREIKRWKGDTRAIPAAAKVLNRPLSLWDSFQAEVITAAVALVVLAGLVAALAHANRRQQRLAAALQRSEQELVGLNLSLEAQVNERTAALAEQAQQLRVAKQEAEAANRAKSAFLATMSHEIRTPLNAMIGTTFLLGQSGLGAAQRKDLKTIEASGKNLLGLINDVLDFSKIEAGELLLDPQPFALADILDDLRAMFGAQAAEKGLGLTLPELSSGAMPSLIGDGNRLRQCLINLIGNALKFTQSGQVELTIRFDPPPPQQQHQQQAPAAVLPLRFSVRDSGIGMSPEQLARLFAPFTQAETSTARRFGGTGLGLSIVKRLVELMGGTVGVESTVGVGSHFWIDLPMAIAAQSAAAEAVGMPHAASRPLHVLVAEDEAPDRAMLVRMVSGFGWNVDGVESGAHMIERVLQRQSQGQPIDCILLDWRLPDLDGLAALRALGSWLERAPMPSVIMVTAADRAALLAAVQQANTVDAAASVAPDNVLTKPVNASTLFNAVNAAQVARGMAPDHLLKFTQVRSEQGRWLAGVRVLVVDDSRLNLEVVGRILEREGAVATLRESGAEALQTLAATHGGFDVVLMDLQMPELDGFETTRHLRRAGHTSLPVIALTAGATAGEQQRASEAGMDDFLTKPIDPSRLVRVLRQTVVQRRGAMLPLALPIAPGLSGAPVAPVAPVAPQAGATVAAAVVDLADPPAGWPRLDGFDMAMAAERLGELEFFGELLDQFVRTYAGLVEVIETEVAAGRAAEAATLLHRFKGEAGNLAAIRLQAAAASLESALRNAAPQPAPGQPVAGLLAALAAAHQVTFATARAWLATRHGPA